MLFDFQIARNFPATFLFLISSLIPVWSENIIRLISALSKLLGCVLAGYGLSRDAWEDLVDTVQPRKDREGLYLSLT